MQIIFCVAWDRDLTDSWAGANNGAAVNQAFLDNGFTSLTSLLRSETTLVADDISISVTGGTAFAIVVKAA